MVSSVSANTFRTFIYPFEMITEKREAVKTLKCKSGTSTIGVITQWHVGHRLWARSLKQSCILTVALVDIVHHPIRNCYARLIRIVAENHWR